jgi:hypothetical protein
MFTVYAEQAFRIAASEIMIQFFFTSSDSAPNSERALSSKC